MSVLLLGLLTGLDNFVVSAGFGATRPRRAALISWVAAVAAMEAAAPAVGYWFASLAATGPELGGPLLIFAGGLTAWGAWRGEVHAGWPLFLAPLALSFDNLAAGAGLAATGGYSISSAAAAGAVAGAVGVAGVWAGRLAAPRLGLAPQAALACCLIAVGIAEVAG